jgi:ABC-type transport system substrate-binding protein
MIEMRNGTARSLRPLLGITLAGCVLAGALAGAMAQETDGTRLRVAFPSFGREILNPGSDSGVAQSNIMNPIFDSLLDVDADGNIVPGLAAKGKPTANANVRKALNIAINRQEMLDVFLGGKGTMPDSPWGMTAATAGVDADFWRAWYERNMPYDPELARKILAEEGYPDGFSGVTIHAFPRPNGPWLPQIAEAVAGYWAAIGVIADIQPIEFGAWRLGGAFGGGRFLDRRCGRSRARRAGALAKRGQ